LLTKLSTSLNKFTSSRLWYYIENILVIGLLFYCIKSLTDYDNVYYQTWKNEAAAKAILAFTAIVFIIRKVRLINWQSLVATLLFGVVALERMHFWADAEDILNAVKPQLVAEWLSLMIIIDIILYKNVNNLFKGANILAILYIAMAIGMIWRRHDRMEPIVLIFPMVLFALIKLDAERKQWFVCRFIDAWFITFIYVMVKSFIERPYEGQRYYGCFVNIGQFGIFMVCCFTIALFSICYAKEKYSRLSFPYFISWIWLIIASYMLYIIDTRTILAGVLLCLAGLFMFVRKDTTKKALIKRSVLIILVLFGIIAFSALAVNICANVSDEWLEAHSIGVWTPITASIKRFRWVAYMLQYHPSGNRIFDLFDSLSSSRLTIWKRYTEYFNYDGNPSISFELPNGYWVYTAHNTYIQFLVEYGFISFINLLLIILITLKNCIRDYLLNEKQIILFLPAFWYFSMLGVWLGESNTIFFPITFFGFMFISLSLNKENSPH